MIGFAAPWLLLALPALPLLWWLLRVTPPQPRRQSFPSPLLLRALPLAEETPARTPWWVLLLRLLAAALIILGLARPVLGPGGASGGGGTLLLVLDDGWAAGPDWPLRLAIAQAELERAGREGRGAALLATAPSEGAQPPRVIGPMPAADLAPRLAALRPRPWAPDRAAALAALEAWARAEPGPFQALYLSDALAHGAPEAAAALMERLAAGGGLTLARAEERPVRLLLPPRAEGDRLHLALRQSPVEQAGEAPVIARGQDGRALARAVFRPAPGATEAETVLDLPTEIRNRVFRLDLAEEPGAGGVVLLDERFRRRPVGLLPGAEEAADAPLIGELFYLDRALSPFAELRRGTVEQLLARPLSVLILADRPIAPGPELEALARFVERGGMLVRFAGARLAEQPDPLLPVQLRAERQLGGALSWEQPQRLAPFPEGSPFAGLPVPAEISVERQVLAEPSARLAERIWARLADGTPLVTAETRGAGRIVLFHVTANAEWSDLPLSGLFVSMLRRLVALSAGVAGGEGEGALAPLETLDGFGRLGPPPPGAQPLPATGEAAISPRHPPGWYGTPGAEGFRRALNLGAALPAPSLHPPPPAGTAQRAIATIPPERDLGPWLLAAALLLLALDLLASLRLRGLLGAARAAAVLLALGAALPAAAQEGQHALVTRLAYVITGDAQTDETMRAGLLGLSDFVNRRTAANLAEPVGVVPGRDDLSFFPLLYFTVRPEAQPLEPAAIAALNAFMRHGGIILFDTRDEGSGEGFAPGARAALRRVTQGLAIPPLMPVPEDHVLRRAFYLLGELPGRFAGGTVWVSREQDRANDSVSPVVIGGHDWAGAWAVDGRGQNLHAAVPGGARQRTLAYRFGANLVMYALTGNYKGDQVHVPAILERLGN
ncbi:DUF4159 domain-containing protein [Rubritepida flocculans]|uniref:DUF4159 domain-containing protein n=1 Tax=Rubritepida flocculans TaxID=182403 RepID=UPI000408C1DE|nr:DUF4159 domain-containing protein [Rubritepida flocculans]